MKNQIRFSRHLDAAHAYIPDWLGLDRSKYLRLDRNESTAPLPPGVTSALARYLTDQGVHAYPEAERLCEPLAAYCAVPPGAVLTTNGSDQAIDLALRAFLNEGDTMLIARPEFAIFSHVAALIGARVHGVPYHEDLTFPYDEFRGAAGQTDPDLIVIINPNNPTGTPVTDDFIREIAEENPGTPVIVDEAYYEFTGRTATALIAAHPNLIILRTFSKAFAMAGLRLGYLVAAPPVIEQITKLRNPFDVNALAVAAAQAQLQDLDPMRRYVRQIVTESKPLTAGFCQRKGIPAYPGEANFVLVKPPDCRAAVEHLRDHGILVRTMSAPLLRGMFRVSMGSPAEMTQFTEVFENYLEGQQ
jgi:histidinol-phosphate aminotransferase